jgi:hypothetical protein
MLCVDVQDVYEVKKEKMLLGKRLVLTTLDFDINIQHPYKPLVVDIRKFLGGYKYTCVSCMEFCELWASKLLQELGL